MQRVSVSSVTCELTALAKSLSLMATRAYGQPPRRDVDTSRRMPPSEHAKVTRRPSVGSGAAESSLTVPTT